LGRAEQALTQAVAEIGEGLAADGFGVAISEVSEGRIALRIVPGPTACWDCLLPLPVLTALAEDALLRHGVSFQKVVVEVETAS
jgi:hypothetical protein